MSARQATRKAPSAGNAAASGESSSATLRTAAAALLGEIATMALSLEKLIAEAHVNGAPELLPAAQSMCMHMGWIADQGAATFGGIAASVAGGRAPYWFLSPAATKALEELQASAQGDAP